MANRLSNPSKLGFKNPINSRHITWLCLIAILASAAGIAVESRRIQEIASFNRATQQGKTPQTDLDRFEAKFSTAYWLAKSGKYKEASLLYVGLLEKANDTQKAMIQHNIGNIFFLKGLAINGTNMTVRDETEYLLRQAKNAYQQALKLDNRHWGTRHNLDRILTMLPATPTPGSGESDSPGLIMGNIPVGLP